MAREDLKYTVGDAHNLPQAAQIINANFDLCDQHEALTPSSDTKPHNIAEVDETSTDTTKNKVISNNLAKLWEDHRVSTTDYTGILKIADLQTKGPWVDVRAFGAKGDGETDD
ncbi:MAG: hypothetical protein DRP97_07360, partial [Candidatus Latescibacterota bacterium]